MELSPDGRIGREDRGWSRRRGSPRARVGGNRPGRGPSAGPGSRDQPGPSWRRWVGKLGPPISGFDTLGDSACVGSFTLFKAASILLLTESKLLFCSRVTETIEIELLLKELNDSTPSTLLIAPSIGWVISLATVSEEAPGYRVSILAKPTSGLGKPVVLSNEVVIIPSTIKRTKLRIVSLVLFRKNLVM